MLSPGFLPMRTNGHPPILFEALPPAASASASRVQAKVDALAPLQALPLAAVNVPEVVGGHYQTIEPRLFAARLQKAHSIPAIVNRITVHHRLNDLRAWVEDTRNEFDITDFVFVGGESHQQSYPGATVNDALQAIAPEVKAAGGRVGVITIPPRRGRQHDEPERLLAKQVAGASFAMSQILLESEYALQLQQDLTRLCDGTTAVPPIFWSLAPVRQVRDLDFLAWLGVHIPLGVASRLRTAPNDDAREALSREINLTIAAELLAHAEEHDYHSLGFTVEHVMQNNVEAAFSLVEELGDLVSAYSYKLPDAVSVPPS